MVRNEQYKQELYLVTFYAVEFYTSMLTRYPRVANIIGEIPRWFEWC
jgi:hypothetical protein